MVVPIFSIIKVSLFRHFSIFQVLTILMKLDALQDWSTNSANFLEWKMEKPLMSYKLKIKAFEITVNVKEGSGNLI